MSTQDLIAGYAAYTNAAELVASEDDAPAISPTTTVTTSSSFCVAISAVSVDNTIDHGC